VTPGGEAQAPGSGKAAEHCQRGRELLDRGEYDGAVAELTEALVSDPESAKAYLLRAVALHHKAEFDRAIADCDEAIRREPDNARAYRCRAAAHAGKGEYDQAVADGDEAVRLAPEDVQGYLLRAAAAHNSGDLDRAVADYDEALRRDPANEWAYRYRGRAYLDREEYGKALADLNEAIRLAPQQAENLLYRGRVFLNEGRFEPAVADFTEAIRLDPRCRAAYQGRGEAWAAVGESAKAAADFESAGGADGGGREMPDQKTLIYPVLQAHFQPAALDSLVVTERSFPARVRADLQRAIDALLGQMKVCHFCAVRRAYAHMVAGLTDLLVRSPQDPPVTAPPEYEEVDVGEEEPVRCLKTGLWLLEVAGARLAVLMQPAQNTPRGFCVGFQVAAVNDPAGARATEGLFKQLEEAVRQAPSYRGKVLSLEWQTPYAGVGTGIRVHKLRPVGRDEVILPRQTLELLERNVIRFVGQRARLAEAGMATKKGILFYGPPGTGKTHTLHYLVGALEGVTTLLVAAEQVMVLGEYMTLARLLQPSMVVLEDADLIGRHRGVAGMVGWEEVLLHQLLNEMDGLREDADVLFVLTTNRPEVLEPALASRPGRIDQAIEFPYPDEEGRAKLVRLYARGVPAAEDVVWAAVKKTERVSAAFIKELMRRAAQFRLERGATGGLAVEDVDNALEEMLFRGGSLNRKLLGCASVGFGAGGERTSPGQE
jgi:cell division protease FtsH